MEMHNTNLSRYRSTIAHGPLIHSKMPMKSSRTEHFAIHDGPTIPSIGTMAKIFTMGYLRLQTAFVPTFLPLKLSHLKSLRGSIELRNRTCKSIGQPATKLLVILSPLDARLTFSQHPELPQGFVRRRDGTCELSIKDLQPSTYPNARYTSTVAGSLIHLNFDLFSLFVVPQVQAYLQALPHRVRPALATKQSHFHSERGPSPLRAHRQA